MGGGAWSNYNPLELDEIGKYTTSSMCYYTMKCVPILCKLQNYSIEGGGGVLDMVHAQCHTYFKEGLETFFF